jgi:ribokinase
MVNLIEAEQLTGIQDDPEQAAEMLAEKYPDSEAVITLGEKGALYRFKDEQIFIPAYSVKAVDTTAAGDTFTGYYLAAKLRGMGAKEAMEKAAYAAAAAVSRQGAAASIPAADEVF